LEQSQQFAANGNISLELFAEELRLAQDQLGQITGKLLPDDLLGKIFSQFCIGK
jgi:tRNA modification GTPase